MMTASPSPPKTPQPLHASRNVWRSNISLAPLSPALLDLFTDSLHGTPLDYIATAPLGEDSFLAFCASAGASSTAPTTASRTRPVKGVVFLTPPSTTSLPLRRYPAPASPITPPAADPHGATLRDVVRAFQAFLSLCIETYWAPCWWLTSALLFIRTFWKTWTLPIVLIGCLVYCWHPLAQQTSARNSQDPAGGTPANFAAPQKIHASTTPQHRRSANPAERPTRFPSFPCAAHSATARPAPSRPLPALPEPYDHIWKCPIGRFGDPTADVPINPHHASQRTILCSDSVPLAEDDLAAPGLRHTQYLKKPLAHHVQALSPHNPVQLQKLAEQLRLLTFSLYRELMRVEDYDSLLRHIFSAFQFEYVTQDPLTAAKTLPYTSATIVNIHDRQLPPALLAALPLPIVAFFYARRSLEQLLLFTGADRLRILKTIRETPFTSLSCFARPAATRQSLHQRGTTRLPTPTQLITVHHILTAWILQQLPALQGDLKNQTFIETPRIAHWLQTTTDRKGNGNVSISQLLPPEPLAQTPIYRVEERTHLQLASTDLHPCDIVAFQDYVWTPTGAGLFLGLASFLLSLQRVRPDLLCRASDYLRQFLDCELPVPFSSSPLALFGGEAEHM